MSIFPKAAGLYAVVEDAGEPIFRVVEIGPEAVGVQIAVGVVGIPYIAGRPWTSRVQLVTLPLGSGITVTGITYYVLR